MPLPLAYFLTWSCYGQRLHGDARGSVDQAHNIPGTPLLTPDPHRQAFERSRLIGDPVVLSSAMRDVIDAELVRLCMERSWFLLARNVRTTHVHVVVNCRGELSPERAMGQFKARSTRGLRMAGLARQDARLWTVHGSTRWINNYSGLAGAIGYVNDWQCGPNRELREDRKLQMQEILARLRAWSSAPNVELRDGQEATVSSAVPPP